MGGKIINVDGISKAGPYSHATMAGGFVFLSGMVGDGSTLREQLLSAVKKVETVLQKAGLGLEDVIKVTVYLSSPELFNQLNEAYKEAFKGNEPARTTVIALPPLKGALIEVDVIAFKDKD